MTTMEDIAEYLHKTHCRYSHTDQCGWEYEKARPNVWIQPTHKHYYGKAIKLVADTDLDVKTIAKVIKAL